MKDEQIIEGNKLIAEFMGGTIRQIMTQTNVFWPPNYRPSYDGRSIDLLEYHSSWDWLIPVTEKVESMGFDFCIMNESTFIRREYDYWQVYKQSNKMEATWLACIEFIKWFNIQKGVSE